MMSTAQPDQFTKRQDAMANYAQVLLNKVWAKNWLQGLRPLHVFIDKEAFSKPRNFEEATTRLELNVQYFATNYALLTLIMVGLVLLMTPMLLVFAVIDAYAWFYVSSVEVIVVPYTPYQIKGRNKYYIMAAITAAFVLFLTGTSLFLVIGLCVILAAGHAVCHETMVDDQDLENGATPMTGTLSDDIPDL